MFFLGVSKAYEVVGHHQHLFNRLWIDDILSQASQQVQPQLSEHVFCEDWFLFGKALSYCRLSHPLVHLHPTIGYESVGGVR